ncbi:MAG: NTP transferase domain-containing protein [Verrucomicrobiota bacterium]|nr:NTP transferase domain-containing protein [Verrucomicrobiota bacterium]
MASDAVILMAGAGSRLGGELAKPLVPIGGRPLICYTLDALQRAGVCNLHIVVGPKSEALIAQIAALLPEPMRLQPIVNDEPQKQNGVSVLCAEGKVTAPFFLTMGDHFFDAAIFETLLAESDCAQVNLAVDHKIEAIFDLDDAMKVRTESGRVVAISKTLADYNAIDTGAFLCSTEIFSALRRAQRDGDCSLADGIRLLANERKVRAVDIGAAWWQDVDTPAMLARAEEESARLLRESGHGLAQKKSVPGQD